MNQSIEGEVYSGPRAEVREPAGPLTAPPRNPAALPIERENRMTDGLDHGVPGQSILNTSGRKPPEHPDADPAGPGAGPAVAAAAQIGAGQPTAVLSSTRPARWCSIAGTKISWTRSALFFIKSLPTKRASSCWWARSRW